MSNAESAELTTGLNMANNVKEMSRGFAFCDPTTPTNWGIESGESSVAAYDDLDDLDGISFTPPIDARRQSLSSYTNWKQTVTVDTVNPASIGTTTTKGSQPINRLTVKVYKSNLEVCSLTWMVSKVE